MTRLRVQGPLQGRLVRACAGVKSAVAWLRLWWTLRWHEKMWHLWAIESVPVGRRSAFAHAIACAIKRGWVEEMSRPGDDE